MNTHRHPHAAMRASALLLSLLMLPGALALTQETAPAVAPDAPAAEPAPPGEQPGVEVVSEDPAEAEGDFEVAAGDTFEGNVAVNDRAVHVRGKVNGSVFATRCEVYLHDGSEVVGDVILSGGKLHLDDSAKIHGSVKVVPESAESPAPEQPAEPQPEPQEEQAPAPPPVPRTHTDEVVRFGQPVNVGVNEIVDGDLVAFGGPVDIAGEVRGDALSFGGPLTISGEVHGDAVATGGPLNLRDGAIVRGDAVTIGGPLNKSGSAVVHGQSRSVGGPLSVPWNVIGGIVNPTTIVRHRSSKIWRALGEGVAWVFGTLSLLLLASLVALMAPRATDTIATKIDEEPGRVALYGVIGWLSVLPILVILVILIVTWIFVPFALLALGLLLLVGCVGVCLYGGKHLAQLCNWRVRSLLGLTLIGLLALRVAGLVTVLPLGEIVAGLIVISVLILGLGSALMTRFGTDPTGTWLGNRHAVTSAAGAPFTPTGPTPPASPLHNEHALDNETLEALTELPPEETDAAGDEEEHEEPDG